MQTVQKGVCIPPKHLTLWYHLNAKHVAASTKTVGAVSTSSSSTSKRCRQAKLDEMTGFRTKISKSTSVKLTNSLTKWITLDCRPVVEDRELETVLQLASGDPTFQLPCQKTISSTIQQLYDTEKQVKLDASQTDLLIWRNYTRSKQNWSNRKSHSYRMFPHGGFQRWIWFLVY